jgi:hypothetical protein
MIDQVDGTRLVEYVADLSGERPVNVEGDTYTIDTRYTYSGEPIHKATQFVGEHLAALGLNVEYHNWENANYPNIVGQITGSSEPNKIFILGGHLDSKSETQLYDAPGADDNASGSAATLLAADIMTQYDWSCTLRFALWTGEEQGMQGSDAYAGRASLAGENIAGYLNLDMIAYNSGEPPEVNLFANSAVLESVHLAGLFEDVVDVYELDLEPVIYIDDPLGNRSDNRSFWEEGYASILAIEDYYGDFNPNYHTTQDLVQYADRDYFVEFVRAAIGTFAHMADCLVTTTPVDIASFTATPVRDGIILQWKTAAENGIQGFDLYRQELRTGSSDGESPYPPHRLNDPLIESLSDGPEGAAYSFFDTSATRGIPYEYWLEVIDSNGQAARHGPLRVEPFWLFLPLLAYTN